MVIETRHLQMVVAIAEQASLTKASAQLHLSQPAVSQQLMGLERRLGAPLFHRTGKRMVPTAIGMRVLASARAMVRELADVEADIKRITTGRTQLLRLATQCYTAYHWLPPVLAALEEQHPCLDIQIVSEATFAPVDALLNGRIDVGIINRAGSDARLRYFPLFEDEMVVVTTPRHRFANMPFVPVEELAHEHLFTYSVPTGRGLVFTALLEPQGVEPQRVTQIQWTDAIVAFVRAGMGVSVLARWAVASHLQSGALCGIPLSRDGFRRPWSAVCLPATVDSPPVLDLVRLLAIGPPNIGAQT